MGYTMEYKFNKLHTYTSRNLSFRFYKSNIMKLQKNADQICKSQKTQQNISYIQFLTYYMAKLVTFFCYPKAAE